jgi:endonuclease/exonuclease/phosphatase (EEP) superfamily protein YafD
MTLLKFTFTSLVLFSVLSATPAAFAIDPVLGERGHEGYPVPADNDVIKTFGIASKLFLPPKNIKFLVWNLHKGTEETFRTEYITLSHDRDIVINQEVTLDDNMMSVFKLFPLFAHTNATSFFTGKQKVRTGVSTISPVRSDETKFVRTMTLEPVVSSPKVTLITRYPILFSMKKLTVVNIHGINFVANKNFRLELERIYQTIKDYPAPLVFTGDFNTWNEDRLQILNDYAKKLGLVEAVFNPDNRMTFNGNPLDHFLHTPDMKVTEAKVDGFYTGSDHKPLEVEVELR